MTTESLTLNPDCTVDVVFPGGEVVRFAGSAEAEEFLDWLENTPSEQRGSNDIRSSLAVNKPGPREGLTAAGEA